jgi:hypothetical protein
MAALKQPAAVRQKAVLRFRHQQPLKQPAAALKQAGLRLPARYKTERLEQTVPDKYCPLVRTLVWPVYR